MKKGQQLLTITRLLLATILVLSIAFVRHYQWPEDGLAANSDEEIETELYIETTEFIEMTDNTQILETEEEIVYEFVKSDVSYFNDALFIGDSRAVELKNMEL